MTLPSNNANKHERPITIYTKAIRRLLSRYITDSVVANADKKFANFKQDSVTPLDLSQKLWGLTVRCCGVYGKYMLGKFFLQGIVIRIRRTIRPWLEECHEATLKDLAYQAQSVLGLQGGQRRSVTKEARLSTESVGRTNKRPKYKSRQCRNMAVQDNGTPSSSGRNAPL